MSESTNRKIDTISGGVKGGTPEALPTPETKEKGEEKPIVPAEPISPPEKESEKTEAPIITVSEKAKTPPPAAEPAPEEKPAEKTEASKEEKGEKKEEEEKSAPQDTKEEEVPVKPQVAPVEAAAPAPTTPEAAGKDAADEPSSPAQEGGDSYDKLFPEPTVTLESPPPWIWWLLLFVGSIVLAVVGYHLANGKINQWLSASSTPTPTASSSPTPTTSPSATPSPTTTPTSTPTSSPSASPSVSPSATGINKAAITLRVLNGTTVTGAAGTARTTLEKAGFKVKSIGNAKTQNYKTTVVYYVKGKQAEAEAVKAALPKYSVTLEESTIAEPDMVLVVIGEK